MTVKEFYDAAGGGYEEIYAKFKADATISSFLNLLKRDTSYATLTEKLEAGDAEAAFVAAHTLKGVVLNLNLAGLNAPVCSITEALRAGDIAAARKVFPDLKAAYERVTNALAQLLP